VRHSILDLPAELKNHTEHVKSPLPAWMLPVGKWYVFCNIGNSEYESVYEEALSVVHEHRVDLVINRDGSATDGINSGGAATVVPGDPATHSDLTVMYTNHQLTSSKMQSRRH